MADDGQLPTPLTPAGSGPGPATPEASSSTHAAFPSIVDLMASSGEQSQQSQQGQQSQQSQQSQQGQQSQGEGSSKMKFLLPTTPEQLFSMIESPAARDMSTVVATLEQLAGGPIAPPLSAALANARPPAPAPLLALPGLDIQTLPDERLRAGTLGFVYVLTTRLNARADVRPAHVLEDAASFCAVAEPLQLAVIPSRVTEFAWSFLRAAQQAGRVDLTLAPLEALLHATSQPSFFNPVHAVFLEACLYAGAYQAGARSLTQVYVNAGEGITYIDVLAYHHHAGTILAMLEQYERATEMFLFAAAMPTSSLSAIQIQCAKRAILCELLSSGKQVQFPKDTSSIVTRWMDKNMQEYLNFAKSFAKGDWGAAQASLETNTAVFGEDNNLGLAKRVLRTITMRRILNLRKTYSRLTVADLTDRVGLSGPAGEAEVLATVQSMAAAKMIRVDVSDGPSPVLTFLDDDDYASPDKMRELKQAQQLASWLHADLERGNRAIGLNKKWLSKQVKYDEREAFPEKYAATRKKTLPDDTGSSGPAPAVRGVGSNLGDMGF